MFDFPAPATNGQTTTLGGVVWTFDGTKWTASPNTTAWAPLASPVFTGDPQAPTAALGDSDTSVATTAFTQTAINAAGGRGNVGRSYIHNALFNVQQRGAGPWTTSAYTADRWHLSLNLDTVNTTIASLGATDIAGIGDESARYGLWNVVTGNAGAGALSMLVQSVEGVRRLSGKTVTVSFWYWGTAGLRVGACLAQNFGTGGSPSAQVIINGGVTPVIVAGAYARYSITLTLPSIAGKTLGTNGDDNTELELWLSSGSTYSSRTGIGVQSGSIGLWGVQLEIGSVATPLEKLDPRLDLANCQRFYQTGGWTLYGYNTAGALLSYDLGLPMTMRAAPTTTVATSGSTNCSGITIVQNGVSQVQVYYTVTAAAAATAYGTFTASADL